jgi:hypothetical protein
MSVGQDIIKALQSTASKKALTLNEKASIDFIRGAQAGYRTKYRELFKAWNSAQTPEARELIETQIRKTTGHYLAAKTQFNYNRMSLSQYGREFGWLFSMFTKWPASISSDVAMKLKEQGLKQGGAKLATQYFGPFIALGLLDNLILHNAHEDPQGMGRYLLGPKGLQGMSPVSSMGDLAGRGLFNSPVLDLAGRAVKGIINADPKQFKEAMERSARAFVPASAYARFLLEDWPLLKEGRKPNTIHEIFQGE